jgi:cysteine sulfinate desulfinase/cysteine desulfurase-like protein
MSNERRLSVSGRKGQGPKGICVPYFLERMRFSALIVGDHREKSRRAGTENAPGIVCRLRILFHPRPAMKGTLLIA